MNEKDLIVIKSVEDLVFVGDRLGEYVAALDDFSDADHLTEQFMTRCTVEDTYLDTVQDLVRQIIFASRDFEESWGYDKKRSEASILFKPKLSSEYDTLSERDPAPLAGTAKTGKMEPLRQTES